MVQRKATINMAINTFMKVKGLGNQCTLTLFTMPLATIDIGDACEFLFLGCWNDYTCTYCWAQIWRWNRANIGTKQFTFTHLTYSYFHYCANQALYRNAENKNMMRCLASIWRWSSPIAIATSNFELTILMFLFELTFLTSMRTLHFNKSLRVAYKFA